MDMDPEQLWQDVRQRRATADGRFVYAVSTTGIYCRPSCPSRQARREHVSFHPDCDAAERAGFRPCRRCDPCRRDAPGAVIAAICRRIDAAETPPRLADLAAASGYSVYHLHRLFKSRTGLTPLQYAAGRRAERLRAALADGSQVTGAIYDAGYSAPSRCYAESDAILGMKPAASLRGGAGEHIGFATAETSLGRLLAAATPRGVCHVALGDDDGELRAALHRRFPAAVIEATPALGGLLDNIVAVIDGDTQTPLPLDLRGTAFQLRVWNALREIPPGATLSYTALAERIGTPGAARAVAGACAANPVAVAVPCHRVVHRDGSISGYRWGVTRKRALLTREATAPTRAAHTEAADARDAPA